jgi:uncharacterized protein involved in type VI secretion and phage assembly
MDENSSDFELQWIYAEYEDGRPVSEIAAELGKAESYVYAQMRKKPEKYEDVKRIREEKYNLTLRRVRGLADKITMEYLERLDSKLNDPNISDEDKDKLYAEIDKVQRIGKQYADRVQLAEGKATQTIGVKNAGGLPFNVVITKTYGRPEDDPEFDGERDGSE